MVSIGTLSDYVPVERLGTDCLEVVPLFPPRPPAGVLQPNTIGNLILLFGHITPRTPDIFLLPLVAEIVNLSAR